MERFNLNRAELAPDETSPEGFEVRDADIRKEIGAQLLGGTIMEIPPGRKAWPYHWEAAQEEWLIVLRGTPTIRTPAGEEVLAEGDVVCFPAGAEGAHQISNVSDAICRLIMVSNRSPVNVIVYPDSGKVGARTPGFNPNFPKDAAVDYWAGE